MSKMKIPTTEELQKLFGTGHNGGPPMSEGMKVKGHFKFELTGPDGKLKQTLDVDNLIVDAGFLLIADSLGNTTRPALVSYIGIGTGTTAASSGQTALVTQLTRVACSYAYATKVLTFASTLAAGTGTGAITEAGMFNASTAGAMLNRVVFAVINKGALDTLVVTFTLTLS